MDKSVGSLVAFIGAVTQMGGSVLLAAFFLLLRGQARRRPYFRAWSLAWVWMSAALFAVFLLYRMGWAPGGAAARAGWMAYQLAKLLFLSSLLAGALAYAAAVRPAAVLRVAVPASLAYAAGSVFVSSGLNRVVALQGPVAAVVLGCCAWLLLRLPRSRSSLGSRATGTVFALMSALWAFYAAAFPFWDSSGAELGGVAGFIVRYNSYLDLLLQMLLGYGMVVLLMEDTRRETDAAHHELAVAHDQLKRVALHDSLTGALNRRAWSEGVGMEAVRASFGAAVMLDLDNLKTVNDVHGHAAGDELLRRTAEVLRAAIRPTDRLFRWGGDEFLVLMAGSRAADARRRIEETVAGAGAGMEDDDPRRLMMSVGAAEFAGGEALDEAIRRADAAMYEEKSRRRGALAARRHPSADAA
ncbi:GGDEF domain-containing protein [Longimicrobium sp.]|uniref:GGDEF domain-containing protein n=1 Tax=Longimicrobium sp. TaxID=2029185 RepID=UPI002CC5DA95|nr:GGDEF domain-containing protein [Longimicrobium sp.]HSU17799.1 GGDEF domain-containing protein [Longimicrobium sp.]